MAAIDEINALIGAYDFPLNVLQDVDKRLSDCTDEHYVNQQLRYLKNIIDRGLASPKKQKTRSLL